MQHIKEDEPVSEHREEINRLAEEFESCQKILLALGDENRQHLMLEMMRMDLEAMNRLIHMLEHARSIMEQLPDRSGEK